MNFKILFLILMIAFSSISFAEISDTTKSLKIEREKFDPARDAEKDIADAIITASKENKNILLDVGGEWCIWCHRLDEFIISNNDIYETLHDNYVVVKVNFSPENKNEKVLSKYSEIQGYPHIFILDSNGELLHSQNTGELEEGKGYSKNKLLSFLNKWKPTENE